MIAQLIVPLLFAFASACSPSVVLPGGCQLLSGNADIGVHYLLTRNASVQFAVVANTTGFISMSIVPNGQVSRTPGDAVFGLYDRNYEIVEEWQINGPTMAAYIPSGVPLSGASVSQVNNHTTTLVFTRPLNAGRFPINAYDVSFDVSYGPPASNLTASSTSRVVANLIAGLPEAYSPIPQSPSPAVPQSPSPAVPQSPSPAVPRGSATACAISLGVVALAAMAAT